MTTTLSPSGVMASLLEGWIQHHDEEIKRFELIIADHLIQSQQSIQKAYSYEKRMADSKKARIRYQQALEELTK